VGEKVLLASLCDDGPSHGSFDVTADKFMADTGFEYEMPYIDGEAVIGCRWSDCGVDVDTWLMGNEVMTEGADRGVFGGAGFGE
jgi:hypothetical protein